MKSFISKLTISLASLLIISLPSAKAVELEGGRTAFEKSPRLLNTVTTLNSIRSWGAKYYFTINLPENAGEAIAKVTIQQRRGSDEIDFYGDETFAFEGERSDKGEELSLGAANWDEENKTISLTFDPPISPGTTFTVGLKPKRNPDVGGIYLFGVTAFPRGKKPEGLYLGVGRLSFFDGNTFNRFFP
ncbi:DUF2808 domain-containing protein [Candidatus Gracilibacteria bacterium]|nr:DUF2808 domain-containing protein [Candidatus Gracilibacteria bacterium]NJP17669.1 DUF2808 domain-containing protein [Hydrococcus sp. CRU_1_1]